MQSAANRSREEGEDFAAAVDVTPDLTDGYSKRETKKNAGEENERRGGEYTCVVRTVSTNSGTVRLSCTTQSQKNRMTIFIESHSIHNKVRV